MEDQLSSFLPVEILNFIAQLVYENGEGQKGMYNFCLVGRAWYSAGIEFLYRCPYIDRGNRFSQFVSTVSPPPRARKPKTDLGSLVQSLFLHRLVHQCSPSQSARLLKATSSGLMQFNAPRVSFAINSLAALSKCHQLRHLDLSLVMGNSIKFPQLKKAISNMEKLSFLSLPSSMHLARADDTKWPEELRSIRIGGLIDPDLMFTFSWPQRIRTLILSRCIEIDSAELVAIFWNPQIQQNLEHFEVRSDNEGLFGNSFWAAIQDISFKEAFWAMHRLRSLRLPADLAFHILQTVGLRSLDEVSSAASPSSPSLRVLEIMSPRDHDTFDNEEFRNTLLSSMMEPVFGNVWSVVVAQDVWSILIQDKHIPREIDDQIWLHLPDEDDSHLEPELAEFELTHHFGLTKRKHFDTSDLR